MRATQETMFGLPVERLEMEQRALFATGVAVNPDVQVRVLERAGDAGAAVLGFEERQGLFGLVTWVRLRDAAGRERAVAAEDVLAGALRVVETEEE